MKHALLLTVLLVMLNGCVCKHHCASRVIILPATPATQIITSQTELAKILEMRWSLARISDFTKYEKSLDTRGRQSTKLEDKDWQGELHSGQKRFSNIRFWAFTKNGKPTEFVAIARRDYRIWVLEIGNIEDLHEQRIIELR